MPVHTVPWHTHLAVLCPRACPRGTRAASGGWQRAGGIPAACRWPRGARAGAVPLTSGGAAGRPGGDGVAALVEEDVGAAGAHLVLLHRLHRAVVVAVPPPVQGVAAVGWGRGEGGHEGGAGTPQAAPHPVQRGREPHGAAGWCWQRGRPIPAGAAVGHSPTPPARAPCPLCTPPPSVLPHSKSPAVPPNPVPHKPHPTCPGGASQASLHTPAVPSKPHVLPHGTSPSSTPQPHAPSPCCAPQTQAVPQSTPCPKPHCPPRGAPKHTPLPCPVPPRTHRCSVRPACCRGGCRRRTGRTGSRGGGSRAGAGVPSGPPPGPGAGPCPAPAGGSAPGW